MHVIALCGGTTENDRAPCPKVQQAVKQLNSSTDSVRKRLQRRDRFTHKALVFVVRRQIVQRAVLHYVEIPPALLAYPEDYGCLDHRDVSGQRKLAKFLVTRVRAIMGW